MQSLEKALPKQNTYTAQINSAVKKNKTNYVFTARHIGSKKLERANIRVIVKYGNQHNLKPGNIIRFNQTPSLIPSAAHKYAFNYKKYLNNKLIFHQVFLDSNELEVLTADANISIRLLGLRVQQYVVNYIDKLDLSEQQKSVLSALTVGYKLNLDKEIKESFSDAGIMHLLAVSGLHVGILYISLVFLFGINNKSLHTPVKRFILILIVVWLYALLTGLSASVVRTALMFSVHIVGKIINRNTSFYNALGISGLVSILANPFIIYDVGFQLSYTAVTGIVFFQPILASIFIPTNKITAGVWGLVTTSVAAQIATLPLSLYYFGKFSTYFWLSNIIAIPLVYLIMVSFPLMVLFSFIDFLKQFFIKVIQLEIYLLDLWTGFITQLPNAVINHIHFPIWSVIFLSLMLVCTVMGILAKKVSYYYVGLLSVIVTLIIGLHHEIKSYDNNELFLLYKYKNRVICYSSGKNALVLSNSEQGLAKEKLSYDLDKYFISEKIQNVDYIQLEHTDKNKLLTINNYSFLLTGMEPFDTSVYNNVDFIMPTKKIKPEEINGINYKYLIFDGLTNPKYYYKQQQLTEQYHLKILNLRQEKAFFITEE